MSPNDPDTTALLVEEAAPQQKPTLEPRRSEKLPEAPPENLPLGPEHWQRVLDRYVNPPVTLDDLLTAARRVR